MKLLEFKKWMIEVCEFKERTSSNRISNCRKVEQIYGDLEINYDKDRCEKIISELDYTTEDERENKSPKHKVKINGNIKNGSATLKQAVKLYVRFENEMFGQESGNESLDNLFKDDDDLFENDDDLFEKESAPQIINRESKGSVYCIDENGFISFDDRPNGFDSLYQLIGSDEDKFIEFFITNSIFISPEAVEKQAVAMKFSIAAEDKIPVRYSQKMKKHFISEDKRPSAVVNRKDAVSKSREFDFFSKERRNVKVEFDSTGNKKVVDAISEYTKIDYSKFINFTLSHVWARTYDPFFFSSLWNIVIIPNYLNPIMDKPKNQQQINEKIQSVVKAICIELYNPNKLLSEKLIVEVDKKSKSIASNFIKSNKLKFLGIGDSINDLLRNL